MVDPLWIDNSDVSVCLSKIALPVVWDTVPEDLELYVWIWPQGMHNDAGFTATGMAANPNTRRDFLYEWTPPNKSFISCSDIISAMKNWMTSEDFNWPEVLGQTNVVVGPLSDQVCFDTEPGSRHLIAGAKGQMGWPMCIHFSPDLEQLLGIDGINTQTEDIIWPIDENRTMLHADLRTFTIFPNTRHIFHSIMRDYLLDTRIDINLDGVQYSLIDDNLYPWLDTVGAEEARFSDTLDTSIIHKVNIPRKFIPLRLTSSHIRSLDIFTTYHGTHKRIRPTADCQSVTYRPYVLLTFKKRTEPWRI